MRNSAPSRGEVRVSERPDQAVSGHRHQWGRTHGVVRIHVVYNRRGYWGEGHQVFRWYGVVYKHDSTMRRT